MSIIINGYLDEFVKPVADGGKGLPSWIESQMTEPRSYSTQDVYDLIQASAELDADTKALKLIHIQTITEWMVGKQFNESIIGAGSGEAITYTPVT